MKARLWNLIPGIWDLEFAIKMLEFSPFVIYMSVFEGNAFML